MIVSTKPWSEGFSVSREELYDYKPLKLEYWNEQQFTAWQAAYYRFKEPMTQTIKDFKPGDLVSFRNHPTAEWYDGVVKTVCQSQGDKVSVHCEKEHKDHWRRIRIDFQDDADIGLLVKRRYLYARGEIIQTHMPAFPGPEWLDVKVVDPEPRSLHGHDGITVDFPKWGIVFRRLDGLRKKPAASAQGETAALHAEVERLKTALEESGKDLEHRTNALRETSSELAAMRDRAEKAEKRFTAEENHGLLLIKEGKILIAQRDKAIAEAEGHWHTLGVVRGQLLAVHERADKAEKERDAALARVVDYERSATGTRTQWLEANLQIANGQCRRWEEDLAKVEKERDAARTELENLRKHLRKLAPSTTASCQLCNGVPIAKWPPNGKGPTHHTCHPGEELGTLIDRAKKFETENKQLRAHISVLEGRLSDVRQGLFEMREALS